MKILLKQLKNTKMNYVIIDDDIVFPVKVIKFYGKLDIDSPIVGKSFNVLVGSVFFIDIFNQPHFYMTSIDEDFSSITLYDKIKWFRRSSFLEKKQESKLDRWKKMAPWELEKIPESEWPDWLQN